MHLDDALNFVLTLGLPQRCLTVGLSDLCRVSCIWNSCSTLLLFYYTLVLLYSCSTLLLFSSTLVLLHPTHHNLQHPLMHCSSIVEEHKDSVRN